MEIVLGIHDGHDSSAAVLVNGVIVAAAQEERYSGLKVDCGFPRLAIQAVLHQAGLSIKDVDHVAVSTERPNPLVMKLKREANFSVDDYIYEQHAFWKPLRYAGETVDYWKLFKDREDFTFDDSYQLDDYLSYHLTPEQRDRAASIRLDNIADLLGTDRAKVRAITHENCHIAYAYFASPLRGEVLSLTCESMGDHSNATVARISEKGLTFLDTTTENYLARLYRYITLLLGLKPVHHEYKVMGLAPYANEYEQAKSYKIFSDLQRVDGIKLRLGTKPSDMFFHYQEALSGHRFDGIAGALQTYTEDVLCKWLTNCVHETGLSRVVFSGGVAQNIKACRAMAQLDAVEDFFVSPAAGDTSISIGACYWAYWQNQLSCGGDVSKILPLDNIYLGSEFSDSEGKAYLAEVRAGEKYDIVENASPDRIAALLANGDILARCSGRMEFGMRALGNRSILADPRRHDTVRKINTAIKFRDFWMPFTPSVLAERADDYLYNPKGLRSPYMAMAFDSTEMGRRDLVAALHPADFTGRPQLLEQRRNPGYHALISAFEKITGVGAVLNTSFNLHGHPIVLGPKEAYFTLENSDLDGIILGDTLVQRRKA